jgi:hypothetical protein
VAILLSIAHVRVRSIEYDFESETIAIGFEDGTVRRESLAVRKEKRPTGIRHYLLDFATGRLALRLPNGRTRRGSSQFRAPAAGTCWPAAQSFTSIRTSGPDSPPPDTAIASYHHGSTRLA